MNYTKLRFLLATFFVILLQISCTRQQEKPNILLILSDDQGYGDVSISGNEYAETPRLDVLANESVWFTRFSVQPVCAPTRATLLTGRHFLRTGVWGVHGGRDYLDLGEITLAQILQENGYHTYMMGKWHLGKTRTYLPYQRGFEKSWSITSRLYQHTDPVINHNGTTINPTGWTVDYLTDLAINLIKDDKIQPFFIYLAYPQIHEPWYAPDSLVKKYLAKGLSVSLSTVYAMNEQLDTNIGRVLDALAQTGKNENTIVIFLGDNGPIGNATNMPHLTDREMDLRNPDGLKGMKGNLTENGIRVPAFIRWTNNFKPRRITEFADAVDIFPTILDLTGIKYETDEKKSDGLSLKLLLEGITDTLPDRDLFYANHDAMWPERTQLYSFLDDKHKLQFEEQVLAIRSGNYKYIQGYGIRELFDLSNDAREKFDLKDSLGFIADSLRLKLHQWYNGILNTPNSYHMPLFYAGYAGEKVNYAYACAPAAIYGNVLTNSHFTSNWRTSGDGQAISIEFLQDDKYDIFLDLKIEKEDGSIITEIGDQRLKQPLVTHNPLYMGSMDLKKGRTQIVVTLTDIPEADHLLISEFKGVILERKTN
jgi:arylsulfatase A-like enzyme